MADLYPPTYTSRQPPYHRHTDPLSSQQSSYAPITSGGIMYPPTQLLNSAHSSSSNGSVDDISDRPPQSGSPKSHEPPTPSKTESKPQATFLTKLYALLERPENHHMIRWDPAGEHIIVERPEQLALHVLPSIYRQSRFASFSRQLNIYGFMRKVNLRNVDPAIDDPDASTWSHPTLNRHSPPEVVANFKRRVPPRLPKPRKRESQESPSLPPPRSAIGMGPVPLSVPSMSHKANTMSPGRSRGFSAPGSFTPLSQAGAAGWGTNFPRSALPPLTVPSDPPHISHGASIYSQSHHTLHPITSNEEAPSSAQFNTMAYHNTSRELLVPSSQYPYSDQGTWSSNFPSVNGNGGSSVHSGSLSSLLNPSTSGHFPRPAPSINTSYASPFSSMPMPMHNETHSASSVSPDSRPTTGYSVSSVSSMAYDDGQHGAHLHQDYSRPNSSHHRPISPSSRPTSSKSSYANGGSLSIRRGRRHSHAMSPYPSPYDNISDQRPSSSPHPLNDHQDSRARSMIQLPSVESYGFNPSHAEFAYSAVPGDGIEGNHGWNGQNHSRVQRPSTGASSISAASHTSSSQANTPPVGETYGNGETDINRFSPDFGFVPMNEHLSSAFAKPPVAEA